ncbi:hypothetical protein K7432_010693 [Basidiobolus ranarum]|uniref:Uncharacterized protein n=1 Tax=Basidiobolus ranarum TaxID=34480 RepID=A0ABR2VVV3_9FUNG
MEKVLSSDYTTPTPKPETEKPLIEGSSDKNRISFGESVKLPVENQDKGGRARAHSLSNQDTSTSSGVAGGIRAAWKRMSVSGWKTSASSPSNNDIVVD